MRNDIAFNNRKCNAIVILESIESNYKLEILSWEKIKDFRDKVRIDEPLEPPGFEREQKLEEPPGFERIVQNQGIDTQHLIGEANNCARKVINTHGEFKEGYEGTVSWYYENEDMNTRSSKIYCSSKEQAGLKAVLEGIAEASASRWSKRD